ncbi:MAG: GvpL/GvpF family gas vesicle protein [Candidatus Eisenbacteria bacterium]|nr:GvpL/GvpF family gas vesicle protein [Candidatus Eisenbacteria bacterium]
MTADGIYVYCVTKGDREESLDVRGIEGARVRVMTHQGLAAIGQDCEPKLFASQGQSVLTDWLLIHQSIVDLSWERYETIVPFAFGMIVVPTNGKPARQNLDEWLEKQSAELNRKLENLKNKAEYGVQVLWDLATIVSRIREQDNEILNLEKEICSKPTGVAYLLQQKLEELIRQRLETAANTHFKAFYQQIRESVEDIRVERIRKEELPRQMILNVSCLQNRDETATLGAVLERIGQIPGFDVQFTGPWPPYSFVSV